MENKSQIDTNLKAILNSPARFTPAVPTPDWNSPPSQPAPGQPASSQTAPGQTTTTANQTASVNFYYILLNIIIYFTKWKSNLMVTMQ